MFISMFFQTFYRFVYPVLSDHCDGYRTLGNEGLMSGCGGDKGLTVENHVYETVYSIVFAPQISVICVL